VLLLPLHLHNTHFALPDTTHNSQTNSFDKIIKGYKYKSAGPRLNPLSHSIQVRIFLGVKNARILRKKKKEISFLK